MTNVLQSHCLLQPLNISYIWVANVLQLHCLISLYLGGQCITIGLSDSAYILYGWQMYYNFSATAVYQSLLQCQIWVANVLQLTECNNTNRRKVFDTASPTCWLQVLETATNLVRDMKDGPRMIELRDADDARKPAKNLRPWVPDNMTGDKGEQVNVVCISISVAWPFTSVVTVRTLSLCIPSWLCHRLR